MNDANTDESARKKDGDDRFRVELPILAQPDTACDQQKCDDDSCDLLGKHRVPPRFSFRRGVALPNQRHAHSYLTTKKQFVSPPSVNRKPIGKRRHENPRRAPPEVFLLTLAAIPTPD